MRRPFLILSYLVALIGLFFTLPGVFFVVITLGTNPFAWVLLIIGILLLVAANKLYTKSQRPSKKELEGKA